MIHKIILSIYRENDKNKYKILIIGRQSEEKMFFVLFL